MVAKTKDKKRAAARPTKKPAKKPAKKSVGAAAGPELTSAVREALERLVHDVLPKAKTLNIGSSTSFYIRVPGNELTVCGIRLRKGVVGLHVPAGGNYDDPEGRLVGKGPAGKHLWLNNIDDVATARPFIEAALAHARS